MNLYLVFAGECYYPDSGAGDFRESFFDRDAAINAAKSLIGSVVREPDSFYDRPIEWANVLAFDTENLLSPIETFQLDKNGEVKPL